jgi:hypothetical protein
MSLNNNQKIKKNICNEDLSDNFSHISPLFNENKKNRMYKNNKIKIQRHDSFLLPRTNSQIKMYKVNK